MTADTGEDRRTIILPVDVTACDDCARRVHDALVGIPGIRGVVVDAKTNLATVDVGVEAYVAGDVRRRLLASLPGAVDHLTHVEAQGAGAADSHDLDHASALGSHVTRGENRRRLVIVLGIAAILLVSELVGAFFANSLVLYSDAAHVSTDVIAVGLSAVAISLAARPATKQHTFGSHRWEIVAAFLNALALWGIGAFLIYEAWTRLLTPPEVNGTIVLVVGLGGLAVNLGMAYILHAGAPHSLNVRSAYIHVLADALGSVAAVATGLGILLFDLPILDPILTFVIALLVLVWTWRLTRETLHILLEGFPVRIDADRLERDILGVAGVADVHDLHVWSLTSGVESMSTHVVVSDESDTDSVARDVRDVAQHSHGISHVTVQIERLDSTCPGCHYV